MKTQDDGQILMELAKRLSFRGTKPSRGIYHQKAIGASWYTPEVRNRNRRDWRHVAHRWLRRFVDGEWHVGGHHVGRPDYGPAIIEAPSRVAADHYPDSSKNPDSSVTAKLAVRVDGKLVVLVLDQRTAKQQPNNLPR